MPDIQIWDRPGPPFAGPLVEAIGALHRQNQPCLWLVPEQSHPPGGAELLTG